MSEFPERVYDAFWTQTPVGMAEFSDRPMKSPPKKDQYYGFFPAKYATTYLESYVDDHVYNGQSLKDRIVFSSPIKKISRRVKMDYGPSIPTQKRHSEPPNSSMQQA